MLRSVIRHTLLPELKAKAVAATDPKEQAFYEGRVVVYTALASRFQDVLAADTSQDAEEEDESEEDDSFSD